MQLTSLIYFKDYTVSDFLSDSPSADDASVYAVLKTLKSLFHFLTPL